MPSHFPCKKTRTIVSPNQKSTTTFLVNWSIIIDKHRINWKIPWKAGGMIATCEGYGTTEMCNGTKYTGGIRCWPSSLVYSRLATNSLVMGFHAFKSLNTDHFNVLNEQMLYTWPGRTNTSAQGHRKVWTALPNTMQNQLFSHKVTWSTKAQWDLYTTASKAALKGYQYILAGSP